MKATTNCRGWEDGDGKWVIRGLGALCLAVLLAGCDRRAVEQAQQEAREAKTAVQQLKHNLGLAQKEILSTQAELNAVRQSRDELQGRIDQIVKERDKALEYAQKAREALAARSSGQTSATTALQQQVAELTALVAEQQKLIDQLQKSAGNEPAGPPPEQTPPAEPNEG
jgi:chromosome segregation ATPase